MSSWCHVSFRSCRDPDYCKGKRQQSDQACLYITLLSVPAEHVPQTGAAVCGMAGATLLAKRMVRDESYCEVAGQGHWKTHPEVQDFPWRVVAHNVAADGSHTRLVEGRP